MTPGLLKQILESHTDYWDDYKHELYRYKSAYATRFWDKKAVGLMSEYVQTSDAYGYIESYIASLFSKNPGVIFKAGLKGRGDTKKAQALANDFLMNQRKEIENASRLALIYPMAFMKLMPNMNEDIYKRISVCSIAPWEVILDRDAKRYEDMRFVGHHYYMSMIDARHKFGNKEYEPIEKEDYFDKFRSEEYERDNDFYEQDFDYYRYIEIVELYDLHTKQMYFWSPNWKMGEKFLLSEEIPFRDPQNNAVIPLVPLYYNRMPDKPIDGYSAMRRIYDQIYETNLIRTFQANGVRKASRQYLVKKGVLDEEQMAQITSGIDGLFVEVDEESLAGVMTALPQNPTPPELQMYYNQVQADKDKGSILAPFTRGESTRSSATEIAALAAYTSSEVGRLARERDSMIEELSRTYIYMLQLYLEIENSADMIMVSNSPEVVRPQDLEENFLIYAQDQASTPLSESVKKREFIQSIPLLQSLGVPQETLLAELVRSLGLPEDFVIEAKENQEAIQAASAAKANVAGSAVQPDAREMMQSTPAGPANLQGVLPGATSIS